MTYNEAYKALLKKYPEVYVSLKYEKAITSSGTETVDISMYCSTKGWSPVFRTFDDVVSYNFPDPDLNPGGDL